MHTIGEKVQVPDFNGFGADINNGEWILRNYRNGGEGEALAKTGGSITYDFTPQIDAIYRIYVTFIYGEFRYTTYNGIFHLGIDGHHIGSIDCVTFSEPVRDMKTLYVGDTIQFTAGNTYTLSITDVDDDKDVSVMSVMLIASNQGSFDGDMNGEFFTFTVDIKTIEDFSDTDETNEGWIRFKVGQGHMLNELINGNTYPISLTNNGDGIVEVDSISFKGPISAGDIGANEVYDVFESTDRPFHYLGACRAGTVPSNENPDWDDCMVYALIHSGSSGIIGSTSLSYLGAMEGIANNFFENLFPSSAHTSMQTGKALKEAKEEYSPYEWGSIERKTVTQHHLYGIPWEVLDPVGKKTALFKQQNNCIEINVSKPDLIAPNLYNKTISINITCYNLTKEENFDIISIPGATLSHAEMKPIIPFAAIPLKLPLSTDITNVEIKSNESALIGHYLIPSTKYEVKECTTPEGKNYTSVVSTLIYSNILGFYPKQLSVDISDFDDYRVANIHLPLIQYNPQTREVIFFNSTVIELTYQTPVTLAITAFSPEKTEYTSGETINASVTVENVGSEALTELQANISLKNLYGQVKASSLSAPFDVASGESKAISVELCQSLPHGSYHIEMKVMNSTGGVLESSSEHIYISTGGITDFFIPNEVESGEDIAFNITFENRNTTSVEATGVVYIYDPHDIEIANLPSLPVTVATDSEELINITWSTVGKEIGEYRAAAYVFANDEAFGPEYRTFEIKSKSKLVFEITSDKEEYYPGETVTITTALEINATPEEPIIITDPIITTFTIDGALVFEYPSPGSECYTFTEDFSWNFIRHHTIPEDGPEGYYDVIVSFTGGKYVETAEDLFFVKAHPTQSKLCTSPDPPSHDFGTVPKDQTRSWDFDITNCGRSTLTWSVTDDQPWMTLSPLRGSTTTGIDTVTVTIDRDYYRGLSSGTHTGHVTITSNGGSKTGTITVKVPDDNTLDPTEFPKRKPITIDNTRNANTLTDYQVKLDVVYEPEMQPDFDDLKFTDSSDDSLNYWVEDYTPRAHATVWVKIPLIPGSGATTCYMYYGNPSASSQSNGDATFEFFDDFGDESIDTGKWTTATTGFGAFVTENRGEINIHTDAISNTTADLISQNSYGPNVAIKFRANISAGQWLDHKGLGFLSTNVGNDWDQAGDSVHWRGQDDDLYASNRYSDSSTNAFIEDGYFSGYRTWEITWLSSEIRYYANGILKATHTTNVPSVGITPRFSLKTYTSAPANPLDVFVDYVYVRKYANPEPTVTIEGTDLAAEWHFDEGSGNIAKDSSGNGNDGIVHDAMWVNGIKGTALQFDGIDDYIEVQDSSSLRINGNIAVEAWVNVEELGSTYHFIVSKHYMATGYTLFINPSNKFSFEINGQPVASSTTPELGNWYHVVGTYDQSQLKIYVNDVLENTKSCTAKLATNNQKLRIGQWSAGGYCFNGTIDEVGVYANALTEREIQNYYQISGEGGK